MNAKTKFILGLLAPIAVVVIALVAVGPRQPAPTRAAKEEPARPAAVAASVPPAPAVEPRPPVPTGETVILPVAQAKKTVPQSAPKANGKDPVQDPDARVALSLVGADPEAEAYWAAAINDPNLSANERQNLIEDLNEDGLSDPKHPGPQDLPLILNRLRLIDELAPYAMDQVNSDAFQEAQKDLLAMLNGKPVP